MTWLLLFILAFTVRPSNSELPDNTEETELLPTVMIVMLVRNKAHVLPYTLTFLENINYPKNRISIWMRSDHNEDDTDTILSIWFNVISFFSCSRRGKIS
jgi:collagen beta-1,O-galactosyltransferase